MKNNNDVVIVATGRSPIGDFGGSLTNLKAHALAAQIMQAVTKKIDIDLNLLDDIILGDCAQSPDEANTARTAMLKAGFPEHIPAVTIQRQCSSAMQAIAQASSIIKAGDADIIMAGGVESMSNAPYVSYNTRWGTRLRHTSLQDTMWEMLYSGSTLVDPPGYIMGQTAETLANKYNISREEQDIIALRSHNNAEAAIKVGKFKDEIIPVIINSKKDNKIIKLDEHVRMGLKIKNLSILKPIFAKNGTITAGNSSGLNDGSAIIILASRKKAQEIGLKPLAKIINYTISGCDPRIMGWGPVPATKKLFKKSGVSLKDIELIELNEAFAAQYLVCEKELGLNREITNVNGSGIGLGHPVGCTGARLVISLLGELKRRNNTIGLATLCVGGGMGMSMLIENE